MKITSRMIALIGVVVIIGILAAAWFLGVSPLLSQAAQSDSERAQVEQQNRLLSAKLDEMRKQFENIDELKTELARLHTLIPDDDDLALFHEAVSGCVYSAGAVPGMITTDDAAAYLVPDTSDPVLVAPGPSLAGKLYTVKVTITFGGADEAPISTEAAISFLDCMHRTLRIFTPTSVDAKADGNGTVSVAGYLYRVTDPAVIPERLAPSPDPSDTASPDPSDTPTSSDTPTPAARR